MFFFVRFSIATIFLAVRFAAVPSHAKPQEVHHASPDATATTAYPRATDALILVVIAAGGGAILRPV
jgi:hypothetical protein